MKSDLQVACLGAGYFSQFHIDAWRRLKRTNLAAVADNDLDKARATGADNVFTSLEDLLHSTSPDILDIITPPPTHFDAIKMAIDSNIPTIICQKPFCTSSDEAKEIVKLASSTGVNLIVHENFRFQPWFRCFKKCLDTELLGQALQLSFRLRTGDGQGTEAYLDRQPYFQTMPRLLVHETAVHYLDTFCFLFGKPKSVYADLRRCNPVIAGEDAAYILLEFEKGKRALFDGNRLLDNPVENCRLTLGDAILEGSSASLRLSANGIVYKRDFGSQKEDILMPAENWRGFGGDCVFALQQHIVEAMLDGGSYENTASEYLSVLDLVESVYESDKLGQRLLLKS